MNKHAVWSCFVGVGICAVAGRPARAADDPLLVVVEAPPALDADAGEIRRAIGSELRAKTVAPTQTATDPPERALIVALEPHRIAMSLRTSDALPIVRAIAAPPERAARLRAIAWLAGNLARDQVSPIVTDLPAAMPSLAEVPSSEPPTATEPPPLAATEARGVDTETIVARPLPSERSHPPRWSITVADGPYIPFPLINRDGSWPTGYHTGPLHLSLINPFADGLSNAVLGSAWHVELQHRTPESGTFFGAALEGTTGDVTTQLIGGRVFVGAAKQLARWRLEATIGAGVEAAELYTYDDTFTRTYTSSNGGISTAPTSVSYTTGTEIRPALYGNASAAVGHPLFENVDAVLGVNVHATTATFNYWSVSSTLGLRYNIQ